MGGLISKKKEVQLPEDVTMEILKKLPVKSLLRFRCVGKIWYSIISDPKFCSKLHRRRSCVLVSKGHRTFSTVTIESLLMNDPTSILPTPLSLPWKPEPGRRFSKLLGSCGGLVCVDQEMSTHGRSQLILWNPSTRKFRRVPSSRRFRDNSVTYSGFGYDESVDDYKFVWLEFNDGRIEFDVFSLKSNTWRSYEYRPRPGIILSGMYRSGEQFNGVFLNGAIHWVINRKDRSSSGVRILALDLSSDRFGMLELPQESDDLGNDSYVVSLSGCLGLCIHYRNPNMSRDSRIHLWMMKEYGVDSSWLKLVSFSTTFFTFYPIRFSDEEGKIVAVVERPSQTFWESYGKASCEIMRLQVEKGAIVRAETLLCYNVSSSDNLWQFHEDNQYNVLHMEETLVSLN